MKYIGLSWLGNALEIFTKCFQNDVLNNIFGGDEM